jgi:hypothetical protein
MLGKEKAYRLVIQVMMALAGKAEPTRHQKLEEVGISTKDTLRQLKRRIDKELAGEGYELAKMSLDSITPSSTLTEVVELVSHAVPRPHEMF